MIYIELLLVKILNFLHVFYCILFVDLSILWCNMIPTRKHYILLFCEYFPIDEKIIFCYQLYLYNYYDNSFLLICTNSKHVQFLILYHYSICNMFYFLPLNKDFVFENRSTFSKPILQHTLYKFKVIFHFKVNSWPILFVYHSIHSIRFVVMCPSDCC